MTVLNLVRDLVPGRLQPPASYRACNSHNVSISEILQEKFIESHSSLYWAIVKRRQPDAHDDLGDPTEPDLLDALIRQSSPLAGGFVVSSPNRGRRYCIHAGLVGIVST